MYFLLALSIDDFSRSAGGGDAEIQVTTETQREREREERKRERERQRERQRERKRYYGSVDFLERLFSSFRKTMPRGQNISYMCLCFSRPTGVTFRVGSTNLTERK
jgi:hypothetical protein